VGNQFLVFFDFDILLLLILQIASHILLYLMNEQWFGFVTMTDGMHTCSSVTQIFRKF